MKVPALLHFVIKNESAYFERARKLWSNFFNTKLNLFEFRCNQVPCTFRIIHKIKRGAKLCKALVAVSHANSRTTTFCDIF